jgi:hypothetical protein
MSRRTVLSMLAGGLLCLAPAPLALAGAQQGRLIVENRSAADVDVYVWRYNGVNWEWSYVTKVRSGFGTPIADVNENDRFRAWLHARSEHQYHTVRFTGGEDRWPIS